MRWWGSGLRMKIGIGLIAAIVAVPVGFALAQDEEDDAPDEGAGASGLPSPDDPAVQAKLEELRDEDPPEWLDPANGRRYTAAEFRAIQAWVHEQAEAGDSDTAPNQIGGVPPELPRHCEAPPDPIGDCGLIRAIREGKIEPGAYTDEELEAAVERAGYSWVAAD
jgi:hypothetical protein